MVGVWSFCKWEEEFVSKIKEEKTKRRESYKSLLDVLTLFPAGLSVTERLSGEEKRSLSCFILIHVITRPL